MTNRFRSQDGLIRQAIIWLIVAVVVGVVALDGIAVFQGKRTVIRNAQNASSSARSAYLTSGGDVSAAKLEAVQQLEDDGSFAIGDIGVQQTSGGQDVIVTVKAGRHVDTYLLHYLKSYAWAKKLLDPTTTETSD